MTLAVNKSAIQNMFLRKNQSRNIPLKIQEITVFCVFTQTQENALSQRDFRAILFYCCLVVLSAVVWGLLLKSNGFNESQELMVRIWSWSWLRKCVSVCHNGVLSNSWSELIFENQLNVKWNTMNVFYIWTLNVLSVQIFFWSHWIYLYNYTLVI